MFDSNITGQNCSHHLRRKKTDIIFKRLCLQKTWFNFPSMQPVFCIILGKSSQFFLLQFLLYTVEIPPISLAHCYYKCIKI